MRSSAFRALAAALFALCAHFADTAVAADGCFRRHVKDGEDLNSSRYETYSRWTARASERVSNRLLLLEREMLVGSYTLTDYDAAADQWSSAGVEVTCEAFVSMTTTPALRRAYPDGPPARLAPPSSFRVAARLKSSVQRKDVEGFLAESKSILDELAAEKRGNCLTRHFVESMARIASLMKSQAARARAAGYVSPEELSWRMIRGHMILLPQVTEIDETAAPLNLKGLPILCYDVPPVPFEGQ